MTMLGAIIVPHPPLIIPAVGRGEERGIQKTIDAYRAAARLVASWQPEVLIVTTPHLVMYADYFHISPGLAAAGDMSRFGAPRERIETRYDTELRRDDTRCFGEQYQAAERRRMAAQRANEDPWVRLARLSVETYVRTGRPLDKLSADLPTELLTQRAGAFASLHVGDRLRGCIGTTAPTRRSVAWEIVHNAVSACSADPRFPPVRASELDSLEYSVDVLGEPEPIISASQLDVKRYGVIVSCGTRRGLLLPDLEGVDTVEQQIAIARQKGGIDVLEKYRLERFEVVRHK